MSNPTSRYLEAQKELKKKAEDFQKKLEKKNLIARDHDIMFIPDVAALERIIA